MKFFLTFLAVFLLPLMASAQTNYFKQESELGQGQSSGVTDAAFTNALDAGRLGSVKFDDTAGMKAFYETRGYEPAWVKSSLFNEAKANAVLGVLEQSWQHGLNPNNYHVTQIRSLIDNASSKNKYELELAVSDALVRYGRDMTGMRINPKAIGQRAKYWRQPLQGLDILDFVAKESNTKGAIEALSPQGNLYKKLQEELVELYKTPPEGSTKRLSTNSTLRPGTTNSQVAILRAKLGLSDASATQGLNYYDDALAKAVMAFQRSHGLKPDGIVGSNTINLINMTRDDRIDQLLVNLERLRWVEEDKPPRYVMVNVPSATLWAVENGQVKIEMPVIVGREKRPTNIFSTTITGIRFNPTWTVPPTIKKDDYFPKLKKDPYYLSDRGIELHDKQGTIDPGTVDWNTVDWGRVNNMRMVQGPGAANPLGRVRVIMNNPFNIYLHDTPNKSYFKRANRALSSGCVRMAEPEKLADFVLEANQGWSKAKKNKIFDSVRMTEIRAEQSMPVYILYQTVWLGNDGKVVYGNDIYGHDTQLISALKKVDGIATQDAQEVVIVKNDKQEVDFYSVNQ